MSKLMPSVCGPAMRGLSRNLRHLLAAWPQLAPRKSRKWLGRSRNRTHSQSSMRREFP